ncbi:MAG: NAD(P)-dependent oxidoreductase [Gemmataceae bacterium]
MRVLITGGYGCIGSWIVRNLLSRGDSVFVLDLREDTRRLRLIAAEEDVARVRFLPGDVTEQVSVQKAIDNNGVDHVIHLAGLQVPTCRADPILGAKVNVLGTLAVFEAVRLAGTRIKRLVYASSAAVYGPPDAYYQGPSYPLPDDASLVPSTHYGIFKVCNEGNARIYFQDFGLSSIGLRPWTVYGVGRDLGMTSEPTKAIKAVAIGRPYAISYGGRQDLQYVDDVAKVFVRALEAPYQGAKSYNLRGAVVDLATFHRTLCSVAPEAEKLVTFGDRQLGIAYDLSDDGLQRDIGPPPATPLAEGIRQTLEAFRRLHAEGRLDTADLDAAPTPPTAPADEP